MGTSPTTQSAQQSGAAKDDVVGLNGDLTFTIADLLANDPGGANKLAGHFFFGTIQWYADHNIVIDWAHGGVPTQANQDAYLATNGITTTDHITYTINAGATDIDYMVQIGNKGTWSVAHVDVAHAGASLFSENFEGYATANNVVNAGGAYEVVVANMANNNGGQATGGWTGDTASSVELGGANYGNALANSSHWLDTQSTVNGVSGLSDTGQIKMSHGFT